VEVLRGVHDAFAAVAWEWVVAAIGLNLLSVLLRAFAWETTIKQSIPRPHPAFPLVFSAFSVGLFANAVLPGRVGELARVAVLRRRIPGRRGTTATLVGSVFAALIVPLVTATVAFPHGASPYDLYEATASSVVRAYVDLALLDLPRTSQYLHYILAFGLLVWATSMFASYAVFGHRRPLGGVVVVGVT